MKYSTTRITSFTNYISKFIRFFITHLSKNFRLILILIWNFLVQALYGTTALALFGTISYQYFPFLVSSTLWHWTFLVQSKQLKYTKRPWCQKGLVPRMAWHRKGMMLKKDCTKKGQHWKGPVRKKGWYQ